MDGIDHSCIWMTISFVRQIPFDRFTTVFAFKFGKKNYSRFTLISDAIENRIFQNTQKNSLSKQKKLMLR